MRRAILLGITGFVISMSGLTNGQSNIPPKVVALPEFTVIGIECRTDNAKEADGKGCIGQQWGRIFSEVLLDKIPDRVDKNIIAVYTDYASDKDGEYTFILGAKVKTGAMAPEGMVKTTVPAGRYAVFTSEKGPVQEVVPATWKRIWTIPKGVPGSSRAYKSDFELYDQRAADPKSSQVDIYIGIP